MLLSVVAGGLTGCGHHTTAGAGTFVSPRASTPAASAGVAALPKSPAPRPYRLGPAGPAAPILTRIPVTQKVAFLTMDDGQVQLPEAPQLMRSLHVPFTMFLIAPVAARNPAFFKEMAAAGGVIEDHTITHPSMRGKSYAAQRHEICGARDQLQKTFGVQMRFFRPPYGNYDSTTLKAVHDCGLQAAFNWSETVNEGKVYYQTSLHRIQPGDIILMHFRPAFVKDVQAALKAIRDSGLTPALLEDYVK